MYVYGNMNRDILLIKFTLNVTVLYSREYKDIPMYVYGNIKRDILVIMFTINVTFCIAERTKISLCMFMET